MTHGSSPPPIARAVALGRLASGVLIDGCVATDRRPAFAFHTDAELSTTCISTRFGEINKPRLGLRQPSKHVAIHAYLYVCVHCLPGVRRCLNLVILSPAACLRHKHFQDGGAAVRRSCSLMDGCSCMGAYRLRYLRQIMLQQCSSVAKKAC